MSKHHKFLVTLLLITLFLKNSSGCNIEQYPYYLHLSNSCGASLLTPRYGLTSGHCCKTPGRLRACSGYAVKDNVEEYEEQHDVAQKIIYPRKSGDEKDERNFQYDYCLLRFADTFELSKKTAMIALATKEDMEKIFNEMPIVQLFGFGGNILKRKGNEGAEEAPQVKKKQECFNASTPTQKSCTEKALTSGIPFDTEYQMCLLEKESAKKIIEVVDTGSPITYKNLQFGIVSFGDADILIISRVDFAYKWIDKYKSTNQAFRGFTVRSSAFAVKINNVLLFVIIIYGYFTSCWGLY